MNSAAAIIILHRVVLLAHCYDESRSTGGILISLEHLNGNGDGKYLLGGLSESTVIYSVAVSGNHML